MPDALQLKDFLTLGSNGLLTFFLYQVWRRLNQVTDVLIENNKRAADERQVIAHAVGLSTQDLKHEVARIRQSRQEEID